ncbi:MAG: helix-turn-helix transcriptional regulator [Methanosarcinaceae archaeon]
MSLQINKIKTNQLRRYRQKRSLRQRDVSNLLGLKQSCDYYRWETGKKLPSLINALKLSSALKCPVEILFIDHFNQIRKEMYHNKLK